MRSIRSVLVLFGAMALAGSGMLSASTITFATFSEFGGNIFQFINGPVSNNNPTNGTLRTLNAAAQPVEFSYLGIDLLDPALEGNQAAHISLTAQTTQTVQTFGTFFSQPFNSLSVSFTRDTPFMGLTNLLTVTVTPVSASLFGTRRGSTANLTADNSGGVDDVIIYTSDFLTFSPDYSANLALAFTSASPCFTIFSAPGAGCTSGGTQMHLPSYPDHGRIRKLRLRTHAAFHLCDSRTGRVLDSDGRVRAPGPDAPPFPRGPVASPIHGTDARGNS